MVVAAMVAPVVVAPAVEAAMWAVEAMGWAGRVETRVAGGMEAALALAAMVVPAAVAAREAVVKAPVEKAMAVVARREAAGMVQAVRVEVGKAGMARMAVVGWAREKAEAARVVVATGTA